MGFSWPRNVVALLLALSFLVFARAVEAQPAFFTCTEIVGFSETEQWYDGGFISAIASPGNWQLRWYSGGSVDKWADRNFSGWTDPTNLVSHCAVGSAAPDRVVMNVSGDYNTNVDWWAHQTQLVIQNIRAHYPREREIALQSVVGGPGGSQCIDPATGHIVRASFNYPYINLGLARSVGGEVVLGISPMVGACSDYVDDIGHLSPSGANFVGREVAAFYMSGGSGGGPAPTSTPTPTFTPVPTSTPTPAPTSTSPPAATNTSTATRTPTAVVPTSTLTPGSGRSPTDTPVPTPTSASGGSPINPPTPTPSMPTATPTAGSPPGGGGPGPGGGGRGPGGGGGSPVSPGTGGASDPGVLTGQSPAPVTLPFSPPTDSASNTPLTIAASPPHATPFDLLSNGTQVYALAPTFSVSVPFDASGALTLLQVSTLESDGVPPLPPGFQSGRYAFQLAAENSPTSFIVPLSVDYQIEPADLLRADADPRRVVLAEWRGSHWVGQPCSTSQGTLSCALSSLGMLAVVIAPQPAGILDWDIAGGHVFRQTNGFGGAGDAGFAVIDDDQAPLWSEFQRLGGGEGVGYPVSNRFLFDGYWTQAFQQLVIQWQPDLGHSVPINVLDELNRRGADAWLDAKRQIPPAVDPLGDVGLDRESVVARHLGMLENYAPLRDIFDQDATALDTYGLPVGVKDYGPFVAVRLQRATFQLWRQPDGSASLAFGNVGDLAKEVGLLPPTAVIPALLPHT